MPTFLLSLYLCYNIFFPVSVILLVHTRFSFFFLFYILVFPSTFILPPNLPLFSSLLSTIEPASSFRTQLSADIPWHSHPPGLQSHPVSTALPLLPALVHCPSTLMTR